MGLLIERIEYLACILEWFGAKRSEPNKHRWDGQAWRGMGLDVASVSKRA